MLRTLLCLILLLGLTRAASALEMADVPLADGFDLPVGKNGKSYYKARGVRPNGHLGEDWNGTSGGDTDLGDPIYSAANGIVTFAEDYRLGWGNVVIIRSAYLENGDTKYVDSLYGHLLDFTVRVGQRIQRGQQIARMGSNRGMYPAHLHFEMRKNINVGMYRSSFPRDWSVYWSPTEFVAAHRTCSGDGRIVSVPINTYPGSPPPVIASTKVYTPTQTISQAMANGTVVGGTSSSSPLRRVYVSSAPSYASSTRISATSTKSTKVTPKPTPKAIAAGPSSTRAPTPVQPDSRKQAPRRTLFRVNRFEDMKVLGYE
ncbi:MAG: peptidoglycan DD-metalloendopeptidase family protein [Chthoniobacteraceae bacterium]